MRWLALLILVVAPSAAGTPDRLAGTWSGTWTRAGDPLHVTVMFDGTGSNRTGSFDSDELQVAGIPFKRVALTGTKLHVELAGDETTTVFDGTLAGDAITGTMAEGATPGSFALQRSQIARPPVHTRDITFANGAVTLAGTIVSPETPGRHPGIVFLHGSGAEARWASRYLAQTFAAHGIVALIYDKRGVGASTGDWREVGFDALADDAAAGVALLRSLPDVDPARVGIYGHSQGATIAPLVAERAPTLGFVIASAPGGVAPADVEIYSVEHAIGVAALPASERADAHAFVRALIDVAYRGAPRATLDAVSTRYAKRSWYFAPPPPTDSYWALSRRIAAFDPIHAWRAVTAPVFVAYGAFDERVPRAGIDAIVHALPARAVVLHVWPHADHTFTIVDPPKHSGWPTHEPDYADTLIAWVLAQ